ncbi:unnamed protein product [Vitrella brassicaformis CCMP3155]|uniref:CCHC-type domain-containing protein n=1 Tax=Vitrella brassicaformis (strain CCMP3155) TaxID=1169540 RepID=A0A0G4GMG6_VITBC|nr:unnamed protein product [Vitrella brassicaformis CCMP3155]|eukprot:CEM31392.1 unnamed protein product [Vitrella brassicaformis CCMP3155]
MGAERFIHSLKAAGCDTVGGLVQLMCDRRTQRAIAGRNRMSAFEAIKAIFTERSRPSPPPVSRSSLPPSHMQHYSPQFALTDAPATPPTTRQDGQRNVGGSSSSGRSRGHHSPDHHAHHRGSHDREHSHERKPSYDPKPLGCRVKGCTHPNCRKTGKHYCKTCGDTDSDHYSSACPKLRKASSSRVRSAADSGGSDDDGNESDDSTAASSRRSRRSSGCSSGSPGGANPMMQPMMQLLMSMMQQPPPPPPAPATGAGQQDTDQTANQNTNQQTNQNANAALAAPVCDPRVLATAMLFNNLFISGQQQQQGGDSPRHRRRSPSPRRPSCGVRGCRIDHSQHKCRRCGKINDHLTRDCTVQCRVPGCKKAHNHYCRLCGDKDSDHWASECPKGITLYHQTSIAAGQAIASGRNMQPGTGGLVGGGIYFAATEQETNRKAHHRGCMIEARVYLGKIKQITKTQIFNYTHQSLQQEGYDSIHVTPMVTGDEYIVFNRAQVKLRKVWDMATKAEIPIKHHDLSQ